MSTAHTVMCDIDNHLLVNRIEDVRYYCAGGYHPVLLGDLLCGRRYRIVHKLGNGSFSTVWLARDRRLRRCVAIKILTADASSTYRDLEVLKRLMGGDSNHPGRKYVLGIEDEFRLTGPNGVHVCLVSRVVGPSIMQMNDCPGRTVGARRLRASTVRRVGQQIALGLAYIHSRGVVHGDITTANMLLQLKDLNEWSKEELYERVGKPKTAWLHTRSGQPLPSLAPDYVVEAVDLGKIDCRWLVEDVLIADFGASFIFDNPPPDPVLTTMAYRAPELFFGATPTYESDIWSLACVIFETRAGLPLFESYFQPTENSIFIGMMQMFGKLPETLWTQWADRKKFYGENGQSLRSSAEDDKEDHEESEKVLDLIKQIGDNDEEEPVYSDSDWGEDSVDEDNEDESQDEDEDGEDNETDGKESQDKQTGGNKHEKYQTNIKRGLTYHGELEGELRSVEYARDFGSSDGEEIEGDARAKDSRSGHSTSHRTISTDGELAGTFYRSSDLGRLGDESQGHEERSLIEPIHTRVSTEEALSLENLLMSCFNYSTTERPSAKELSKHPWFTASF